MITAHTCVVLPQFNNVLSSDRHYRISPGETQSLCYRFSEPGTPSSSSSRNGKLIVGLTTQHRKKIVVKKPPTKARTKETDDPNGKRKRKNKEIHRSKLSNN
jgi:hypothetical protein